MADWIGITVTILIISFIMLIVWSKVQGDKITDILAEIRDLLKGE